MKMWREKVKTIPIITVALGIKNIFMNMKYRSYAWILNTTRYKENSLHLTQDSMNPIIKSQHNPQTKDAFHIAITQ